MSGRKTEIRYLDWMIEGLVLLLVFTTPLVFYTGTSEAFEYNKVMLVRLLVILMWTLWLAKVLGRKKVCWVHTSLDLPLIYFIITSIVTTIFSVNRRTSLVGTHESFAGLYTILSYGLLYFIVSNNIYHLRQVHRIIWAIIIASTISAGYGLVQYFSLDPIHWHPDTISTYLDELRIFSTLGNPIIFAAFLIMVIPWVLVKLFYAHSMAARAGLMAIFLLLLSAVILSLSRGAWIGLVIALIWLFFSLSYTGSRPIIGRLRPNQELASDHPPANHWCSLPKPFLLSLVMALGLLITLLIIPGPWNNYQRDRFFRVKEIFDPSSHSSAARLIYWRTAWNIFQQYPWLGSGLDTFQMVFPRFRPVEYWQLEWGRTPVKAHNEYLHTLATQGLMGLSVWLIILLVFLRRIFRAWKTVSHEGRWIYLAITSSIVAFLVQDAFGFTVMAIGVFFWIEMALGMITDKILLSSRPRDNKIPTQSDKDKSYCALGLGRGVLIALMSLSLVVPLGWYLVGKPYLANIYYRQGINSFSQPPEAIRYLEEAVFMDPGQELYWTHLGLAYEMVAGLSGQEKALLLDKAEQAHKKAISLNRHNGYSWSNLGRVYKLRGVWFDPSYYDSAATAYNKALRLDPYNAYFYLEAADLSWARGDFIKAKQLIRRCQKFYPQFALSYSRLGFIELARGNWTDATRWLEEALARHLMNIPGRYCQQ